MFGLKCLLKCSWLSVVLMLGLKLRCVVNVLLLWCMNIMVCVNVRLVSRFFDVSVSIGVSMCLDGSVCRLVRLVLR